MKAIRKSKRGFRNQELAIKLNVVRQTISKWEQGLSVPDSDMLIAISEVLETPVSTLLGEKVIAAEADELKGDFRKAGGDKLTARTEKNHKAKGPARASHLIVRGYSSGLRILIDAKKPLLGLGL